MERTPEPEHYPESPDEVIDPRWKRLLHGEMPTDPDHHPESAAQLGHDMTEIIEPWQRGLRGTRETLEALRQLANREL